MKLGVLFIAIIAALSMACLNGVDGRRFFGPRLRKIVKQYIFN